MADELMAYDEEQAVKFIRSFIPENIRDKYTDDEILLVIDTIWDYYESKGMLEVSADADEEDETDVAALSAYVAKEIKKDGEIVMDGSDIDQIVKGELAYEKTLEIFGD